MAPFSGCRYSFSTAYMRFQSTFFALGFGLLLASPVPAKASNVMWDNWYTVSVPDATGKGTIPYATYNEKAEAVTTAGAKKGQSQSRLRIELHIRKKEDGFINEEHTGAFAEDTPKVRPLFFNMVQNFRSSQSTIDGTFDDKNMLQVRVKDANTKGDGQIYRRQIPKDTILLSLFPLWFRANVSAITQAKGAVGFLAVAEDDLQGNFAPDTGKVRVLPPDDLCKNENLMKIEVQVSGNFSHWWVKPTGEFKKLIFPKRGMEMSLTTKAVAETYLN